MDSGFLWIFFPDPRVLVVNAGAESARTRSGLFDRGSSGEVTGMRVLLAHVHRGAPYAEQDEEQPLRAATAGPDPGGTEERS
ncbi:hypothetical protein GCM10009642_43040 [Nocardiopsis metallicus]